MSGLRRFVEAEADAAPAEPPPEVCEMCATPIGDEHSHVVDLQGHSLLCTCRPCTLLFTRAEAAGGRFRAVPDRVLTDPGRCLTHAAWDTLQIPVSMAFFMSSSASGEVSAFYPSPAGATQCLLDLDAWARLVDEHPLLAAAEPDVEAVIVLEAAPASEVESSGGFEYFVVPVDACYELVGRVRMSWKGFDGGSQAHRDIDEFFARLRGRASSYAGTS